MHCIQKIIFDFIEKVKTISQDLDIYAARAIIRQYSLWSFQPYFADNEMNSFEKPLNPFIQSNSSDQRSVDYNFFSEEVLKYVNKKDKLVKS